MGSLLDFALPCRPSATLPKEGFANPLLHTRIERINISDCTVSVDPLVLHRSKTSP